MCALIMCVWRVSSPPPPAPHHSSKLACVPGPGAPAAYYVQGATVRIRQPGRACPFSPGPVAAHATQHPASARTPHLDARAPHPPVPAGRGRPECVCKQYSHAQPVEGAGFGFGGLRGGVSSLAGCPCPASIYREGHASCHAFCAPWGPPSLPRSPAGPLCVCVCGDRSLLVGWLCDPLFLNVHFGGY